VNPLDVACPLCGRAAGERCVTLGQGTERPPHGDREDAAKRAARGLLPDPNQLTLGGI
jgi:hypothetical protein